MVGVSDDIIAQRLAAFGELLRLCPGLAPIGPASALACALTRAHPCFAGEAFMASFDEPSTSAPRQRPQPAPAPPAAGQGRQQAGRKDAPPRQQQPAPSAAAPLAASPSKPPRNEIDEVMRKHKSRLQSQQQRAGSASPQQRQRDTSSAPLTAGRTPANTPSQSERKKFMSPKVRAR